jgi:hypothetical protein
MEEFFKQIQKISTSYLAKLKFIFKDNNLNFGKNEGNV